MLTKITSKNIEEFKKINDKKTHPQTKLIKTSLILFFDLKQRKEWDPIGKKMYENYYKEYGVLEKNKDFLRTIESEVEKKIASKMNSLIKKNDLKGIIDTWIITPKSLKKILQVRLLLLYLLKDSLKKGIINKVENTTLIY